MQGQLSTYTKYDNNYNHFLSNHFLFLNLWNMSYILDHTDEKAYYLKEMADFELCHV